MELEFRNVHIDMLAIPIDKQNNPFTPREAKLVQEYDREFSVTSGVVLALKKRSAMRYEVVHGFEVIRAAGKVGIEYIPCLIGVEFTDVFIDLLQSSPAQDGALPAPEDAIQKAIQTYNQLKGLRLSFRKAEKIGKLGKKSTLYDEKRLAENLDDRVQILVKEQKLSKSAARSISYLPLNEQYKFSLAAIEYKWSVKQIDLARSNSRDSPIDTSMKNDLDSLASDLSMLTGCTTKILPKTRLSGKLQFDYYSLEGLVSLAEMLSEIPLEFTYSISGTHSKLGATDSASSLMVDYQDLDLIDNIKRLFMRGKEAE